MFTAGFAQMGQCRKNFQLKCDCFCDEGLSVTEQTQQMMSCESVAGIPQGPAPAERSSQVSWHILTELSQGDGVSQDSCQLPKAQIGDTADG